jgi:DNA-binding transcriptional regulator LsrR (DeoR family)
MGNQNVLAFKKRPRGTIQPTEKALQVFELVKANELSRKEIAAKLGISVRRVAELLMSAREADRDERRILAVAGGSR